MELEQFKKAFNDASELEKWQLVIENQDLGLEVQIDNDIIIVSISENDFLEFDNFGYDSVYDILKVLKVKADYV